MCGIVPGESVQVQFKAGRTLSRALWASFLLEYADSIKGWGQTLGLPIQQAPHLIANLPSWLYPMIATPNQLSEFAMMRTANFKLHLCNFRKDLSNTLREKLPGALETLSQDIRSITRSHNSNKALVRKFLELYGCFALQILTKSGDLHLYSEDSIRRFMAYLLGCFTIDDWTSNDQGQWTIMIDDKNLLIRRKQFRRFWSKARQFWWRLLGYLKMVFTSPQTKEGRALLLLSQANEFTYINCPKCRSSVDEIADIGGYSWEISGEGFYRNWN